MLTRARRFTEDNLLFTVLLLSICVTVFVGGYALFLQAQRADAGNSLSRNWKAWFIIGCYSALALVSVVLTGRRARILALKLKRIPQKENDAPSTVRHFIQDEYWRTAAIAYVSQPKGGTQKGYGAPGTQYEGICFRRAILDTVQIVDAHARTVAPRLDDLRPHICMARHLRSLARLFSSAKSSCLHDYDFIVQLARYSLQEPTVAEFERGIRAYHELINILTDEQLEPA